MRTIRVGDTVRAFLDLRIHGKVVEIVYLPSSISLMVGGVPSTEAYADILLESKKTIRVKMAELFLEG